MFEDALKKLMAEKEKAKAFAGIDFKNLSKSMQEDMLKAGMASMGKEYSPNQDFKKSSSRSHMVNAHSQRKKFGK